MEKLACITVVRHESYPKDKAKPFAVFFKVFEETGYVTSMVRYSSHEDGPTLVAAEGYTVLSEDEWQERVVPLLEAAERKRAEARETERIGRVLAALEEEEPFLVELRQKYPLAHMEEELRRNSRPTLVQALGRGLAWSAMIPGEKDGRLFRVEEDGSISSTTLGALYIGCFGLPAVFDVLAACDTGIGRSAGNEALQQVLDGIQNAIRSWRRKSGTYRDLNRHYAMYVSGAARGSGHKTQTHVWYEDLLSCPFRARTTFLEWARECDARLAHSLQEEAERWRQANSGR